MRSERESRPPGQRREPGFLQRDVVVGIEVVDTHDRRAAREQRLRRGHADESRHAGHEHRVHRARPPSCSARSFAYLRKLANAPIAMWAKPGGAVEEAQPEHVEAEEARDRRQHQLRGAGAFAARMHRGRPAPSCSDSAWRCRRRSTRPTRAAGLRAAWPPDRRRRPFRGPGRRTSARAGGRTAGCSSPGSLRRARASGRGSGCGARWSRPPPRAPARARTVRGSPLPVPA